MEDGQHAKFMYTTEEENKLEVEQCLNHVNVITWTNLGFFHEFLVNV